MQSIEKLAEAVKKMVDWLVQNCMRDAIIECRHLLPNVGQVIHCVVGPCAGVGVPLGRFYTNCLTSFLTFSSELQKNNMVERQGNCSIPASARFALEQPMEL